VPTGVRNNSIGSQISVVHRYQWFTYISGSQISLAHRYHWFTDINALVHRYQWFTDSIGCCCLWPLESHGRPEPRLPPAAPRTSSHSSNIGSQISVVHRYHWLTDMIGCSCSRFLRHVPVVYVDYPGQLSLVQIYGTFNRAMLRIIPSLRTFSEPLTNAMVELYLLSQVRVCLSVCECVCVCAYMCVCMNKT